MKIPKIAIAMMSGAAVLLSSCVVDPGTYYGASVSYSTPGFSTSVAWTNASYDANGYPIYGYSYGRPVYGYTSAGVAIFTIGALTALCYVPDWAPAPWYHGPLYYPPHIYRVPAPPRYAHGHAPHHRPAGGMHAPIHKNPSSILGKPNHTVHHKPHVNHKPNHHDKPHVSNHKPNMGANHRPNVGVNHKPNVGVNHRPNVGANHKPNVGVNHRPNVGANQRPNAGANHKPNQVKPNNVGNNRPTQNRVQNTQRPSLNVSHAQSQRPQHTRPSVSKSPASVRPQVSRPAAAARPAAAPRPAHNRASGAAHSGGRAVGRGGARH